MRLHTRGRAVIAGLSAITALAVGRSAAAQDGGVTPTCSAVLPAGVPTVLLKGSTAAKPFIKALGLSLYGAAPATNTIILYSAGGSCTGVDGIVSNTPITGTVAYWNPALTPDGGVAADQSCTIADPDGGAGVQAGIGISDVFAQSCAGHATDMPSATTWDDFLGPVQTMVFIVPKSNMASNAISMEAAYFTFGMTTKTIDPWTDATQLFARNGSSGTQSMIAKAINVPATAWKAVDSGSAGTVLNNVKGSASPTKAIGIVSTGESDANRDTVKVLAYQKQGDNCGLWPDSSPTKFDKINVRTGAYDIWGPIHLLTKVTGGMPTDPNVAKVVGYLTGTVAPPGGPTQIIDVATSTYTVPQCAMQMKRTSEVGTPMSYAPATPCGCYFEAHAGGAAGSTTCKTCTGDTDCADAGTNTHCRYGYCEAR